MAAIVVDAVMEMVAVVAIPMVVLSQTNLVACMAARTNGANVCTTRIVMQMLPESTLANRTNNNGGRGHGFQQQSGRGGGGNRNSNNGNYYADEGNSQPHEMVAEVISSIQEMDCRTTAFMLDH
jgi:hypothetical protein